MVSGDLIVGQRADVTLLAFDPRALDYRWCLELPRAMTTATVDGDRILVATGGHGDSGDAQLTAVDAASRSPV